MATEFCLVMAFSSWNSKVTSALSNMSTGLRDMDDVGKVESTDRNGGLQDPLCGLRNVISHEENTGSPRCRINWEILHVWGRNPR